jgi:hypothetical protein
MVLKSIVKKHIMLRTKKPAVDAAGSSYSNHFEPSFSRLLEAKGLLCNKTTNQDVLKGALLHDE